MSLRRRLAVAAPLVLLTALAAVGSTAEGAPAKGPRTVTVTGTAYQFASVHTFLAGATIGVLEDKKAKATVADDGTYSLAVKNNADVTPYITADGYGTIYLQTFHTSGADLENVNFQTPRTADMGVLALALGTTIEKSGYPPKCSIVTTVNTKQVRGVSYEQFVGWGAHGVAGVVATLKPEKGTKLTAKQKKGIIETYFDHTTTPRASQFPSSTDGGVGWTHVPAGHYVLTAKGAGSSWPAVHVTCANGRIINANPPWGLHQLATTIGTQLSTNWDSTHGAPVLTELTLGAVPTQSIPDGAWDSEDIDFNGKVTVSCRGTGCFDPVTVSGSMTGPTDILPALGDAVSRIAPGQTISVAIAVPGYNTRIESWRIPATGHPTLTTTCIPLGDTEILTKC